MQSILHFQQNVPADKKMRPLLQQVNTVHSSVLEGFFSLNTLFLALHSGEQLILKVCIDITFNPFNI
jgi:hypothetical protein